MKKYMKPVIDLVSTGTRIRSLRLQSGISVRTLQTIFCFSYPQAIYNWEHGIDIPKIDNLIVLAQVFGVAIEDIIVTRMVEVDVDTDDDGGILVSA